MGGCPGIPSSWQCQGSTTWAESPSPSQDRSLGDLLLEIDTDSQSAGFFKRNGSGSGALAQDSSFGVCSKNDSTHHIACKCHLYPILFSGFFGLHPKTLPVLTSSALWAIPTAPLSVFPLKPSGSVSILVPKCNAALGKVKGK